MMAGDEDSGRRSRVLDPVERNSEVLFGLFMVLTFTGTISVATAGREEVQTMVVAALGCNTAWGFVDAVMFVLRGLVERGRKAALVRAVHTAARSDDARRLIVAELGPLASTLGADGLAVIQRAVLALPVAEQRSVKVRRVDLLGALAVFLLVFGSTLPVVLPFVLVDDLVRANRLSAIVAIAMLFLCGWGWARHAGLRPLRTGLLMVALGIVIEGVVIALGG
jgi:hypothetical protein